MSDDGGYEHEDAGVEYAHNPPCQAIAMHPSPYVHADFPWNSDAYDYEPDAYDEPEPDVNEEGEPSEATLDPNADGVVDVGGGTDPAARGPGRGKTTGGVRDKKIPKEKRNTTPYMTKYERARVLGTRALQIR